MTVPLPVTNIDNLDPQRFAFWLPPEGHVIHVGPGQEAVPLPRIPLPIRRTDLDAAAPGDNAVGEGVYDYLRQFPDCPYNSEYAHLLRDGYAHFLADLAAHVVMLDAKDVEPAYVFRKLTYLKILRLLEPDNTGLLWQLARGFYGLAMTFTELPQVRRNLLEAMRFALALVKQKAEDAAALNLLAEIDILFGDYPAAVGRLRKVTDIVTDRQLLARIEARLDKCTATGLPDHPLVDDLERAGEAMQLYAAQEYRPATEILERLEEDAYFMSEFKSANFLCLLGMCRIKTGDRGGAFDALSQALELDPEHEQSRAALQSL
jgi:tetratricopeptide (TPR) repeat protein